MVCWAPRTENPWFQLPMEVVGDFFGAQPKPPARAPGPTAFAEVAYVLEILEGAGFKDVSIDTKTIELDAGDDLDSTAKQVIFMGPAARALLQYKPEQATIDQMIAAMREKLSPFVTKDSIRVPGLVHYLTAKNAE